MDIEVKSFHSQNIYNILFIYTTYCSDTIYTDPHETTITSCVWYMDTNLEQLLKLRLLSRVGWLHGEATHPPLVWNILLHSQEPILTPCGAPGVLQQPIFGAIPVQKNIWCRH